MFIVLTRANKNNSMYENSAITLQYQFITEFIIVIKDTVYP